MPRKTKKQKLRAHTHTSQLPKRESVIIKEAQEKKPAVTVNTGTPSPRKEQLPLIPAQKKNPFPEPLSTVASTYFRQDIQKTALLTGVIVVIEIILYQLMQNGTLAKWIPTLQI